MESIIAWTEGLQLRGDHLLPVNALALETCKNLRCHRGALRQFHAITQPVTNTYISSTLSETKAWPYPQIFLGKRVSLLCFEQTIYTLTEASGNWTATAVTLKDAADFEATTPGGATLSTGYGPWQFMDFGDAWMLFNGAAVVFKSPLRSETFATEAVTIRHGGVWRDTRGVLAGFGSNFFALSDWRSYLMDFKGNAPQEVQDLMAALTQGPDKNWAFVTSMGGEELWFPFSLNWTKYASLASAPNMGFTDAKPFLFDLIGRREFSFLPLPWQGQAVAGLPLGDGYAIYGQTDPSTYKHGGVTGLYPTERLAGLRDIFGLAPGIGIAGRGAVAGDETGHIFLDETSLLWEVSADFTAKLAGRGTGYQEPLSDLTAADVLISHDPRHKEFYITDGETVFVYNESGLCEAPNAPSTLHVSRGGLAGIYFPVASPTSLALLSHPFQLRAPGTSVLEYVEVVGLDEDAGLTVSIDYRMRQQDNWTTSAGVAVNTQGRAYFHQAGWQFRWRIVHDTAAHVVLDGVYVRLNNMAKRRGAHWLAAATPSTVEIPT